MTDLRNIEKPFGLLDKATQEALKAHDGPIELFSGYEWKTVSNPQWSPATVYRVKPQPKVVYVNEYGDGEHYAYDSDVTAKARASRATRRIAVRYIEDTEERT